MAFGKLRRIHVLRNVTLAEHKEIAGHSLGFLERR